MGRPCLEHLAAHDVIYAFVEFHPQAEAECLAVGIQARHTACTAQPEQQGFHEALGIVVKGVFTDCTLYQHLFEMQPGFGAGCAVTLVQMIVKREFAGEDIAPLHIRLCGVGMDVNTGRNALLRLAIFPEQGDIGIGTVTHTCVRGMPVLPQTIGADAAAVVIGFVCLGVEGDARVAATFVGTEHDDLHGIEQ